MRFSPTVRVEIMGVEYTVTGYEDVQYLRRVAALVDERMRQLQQLSPDIPPTKNAILAALNIADEMLRLRDQLAQVEEDAVQFNQSVAERTRKLIDLCDQVELD